MFQLDPFAEAMAAAEQQLSTETPQVKDARGLGSFFRSFSQRRLAKRLPEVGIAAVRSVLAFPAGFERFVVDPILPGENTAVRDIVEATQFAQETVRELSGLPQSGAVDFTGEMIGAIAIGAPILKTGKFIVNRLPGALKFINPESAKFAGLTIGAESGLFVGGIDPEATAQEIFGATLLGAGVGAGVTRLVNKLAASSVPAGTAKAAEIQANLRLTANIPDDILAASNEGIAGVRLSLAAKGEGGAAGVVRSNPVTPSELTRLTSEFPDQRFVQVGDDLLHGRKPGTKLPEGSTSSPGVLTDRAIKDYATSGFLPGHKVLINGSQEAQFVRQVSPDLLIIKESGKSRPVAKSAVTRASSDVGGALVNPRLLDDYIQFKGARSLTNEDEAIARYVAQVDINDVDPALRPHLAEYLSNEMTLRARARMRPDETAIFAEFEAAKRRAAASGRPANLVEAAAAKGHSVTTRSGDRFVLTDMTTGRSTRPFVGQDKVRAWLDGLEVNAPDITPPLPPGITKELVQGSAFTGVPLQPGLDAGEQIIDTTIKRAISVAKKSPKAALNLMYRTTGRWFRDVEAASLDIERRGLGNIFTDHIQELSDQASRATNRMAFHGRRFLSKQSFGGLKQQDIDLIEGWLSSDTKQLFETSQGMSKNLIKRAESTRKFLDDFFDEISAQSGTTLTQDDYFRNFVPDMLEVFASTGNRDLIGHNVGIGKEIPEGLKFVNELFKTGEAGLQAKSLEVRIHRLIRGGTRKAYMGDAFAKARAALPDLENVQAQRVLADYLSGIEGNADATRDLLRESVAGLYKDLGVFVTPDQATTVVDNLIAHSYSAFMGFRAQMVMRNATQPINMGAMINRKGARRILKATLSARKPAKIKWALDIGLVRDAPPFTLGEGLAPKIGKTGRARQAVRTFQRASLVGRIDPSKSAHVASYSGMDQMNRVVVGDAMADAVREFLPALKSGKLNRTEFSHYSNTGLSFFDLPEQKIFFDLLDGSRIAGAIGDTPTDRAVNYIAVRAGNRINALYGKAQSPAWIRTAPGKIAGGYSTFGFNYGKYLQMMLTNGTATERAARLAKHATINYAVVATGSAVGLDLTRWITGNSINFVGGMGWVGGPHVGLITDGITSLNGQPWEKERARDNLKRDIPRILIPGASFFRDIKTAAEYVADDRPASEVIARALGFTVKQPERSLPRSFN